MLNKIIRLLLLILTLFYSFVLSKITVTKSNYSGFSQVTQITIGAHLRPSSNYEDQILNFNQQIQKNIGVIMYFTDWSGQPNQKNQVIDDYLIKQVEKIPLENRPVILLTWQPVMLSSLIDDEIGNECRPLKNGFVFYDTIISGKCDNYIKGVAIDLAEHSSTRFILRFAHEMNISDSLWWPGHYGDSPKKYIEMWKHVYDVFEQAHRQSGATNVEWMWSINYASYPNEQWNAYFNYYPGDDLVDWIGISGYNWGKPILTFEQIYGNIRGDGAEIPPDVIRDLSCRYAKPLIISEIGTVGNIEDKANWIKSALELSKQFPFLRGIVWFNDFAYANPNSADFRVTGTGVPEQVTSAFRESIRSENFNSRLPRADDVTPPIRYCGNGESIHEIRPTSVILRPKDSTIVKIMSIESEQSEDFYVMNTLDCLYYSIRTTMLNVPFVTREIYISSEYCSEGKYEIEFIKSNFRESINIIISENKTDLFLPLTIKN